MKPDRGFLRTLKCIALAATALACALSISTAQPQAQPGPPQKQLKDQGESDIYNQAIKDASNPLKAIEDLDAWTDKYPDSDFKNDRLFLYMQAYSAMLPPQPQRALEIAQHLMAEDLTAAFPGTAGGRTILTLLFQVAWNVAALPSASQDQLMLGDKAARQLLGSAPKYFVAANKPPSVTEADWTKTRDDLETRTRVALAAIVLAPANQALANGDCALADTQFRKALSEYPANALISYNLGRALSCEAKANPAQGADFASRAIYEFARTAAIDPTMGGTADAKKIAAYVLSAYTAYHGSEEGLEQLKQRAKASPFPPAGFAIETAAAALNRTQTERTAKLGQYLLWASIKAKLSDANGQQYFDDQLKDADVKGENRGRALKGTLVEAKPACRSRELLVAVPDPEQPDAKTPAEITLKLDAPLSGRPITGGTIEWDGVATALTREPALMLTMETARTRIGGLKLEPCAITPGVPNKK